MNFVAIDFETASYAQNSACSVGLVKVVNGEIVESVVHLIRPPSREFIFTYIHGLTWKDVEDALDFGALWPRIAPLFEGADFLAAHNASFDRGVLTACRATHGIEADPPPFRCTVQLARKTWNIFPTKLPNVCRELGIELKHHEALSDALACARIVLAAQSAAAPPARERTPRRSGNAAPAAARKQEETRESKAKQRQTAGKQAAQPEETKENNSVANPYFSEPWQGG